MHITKVRARDLRRDVYVGCISGVLLLETGAGQISLNVTASEQGTLRDGLWSDALRQLQCLPEFRRNVEQITLAAAALDGMCAEA
jgi:hypothetical protein